MILNVVGNIKNENSCKFLFVNFVSFIWFFNVIVFVINGNLVDVIDVVNVIIIIVNLFGLVLKIEKRFNNCVLEYLVDVDMIFIKVNWLINLKIVIFELMIINGIVFLMVFNNNFFVVIFILFLL